MLDQEICLVPVPMDGWLHEGPAIQWLKYGDRKKIDLTPYNFGRGVGSVEGSRMSAFTVQSTQFCGVLNIANGTWQEHHGTASFGTTH
eukprot:2957518-Ditylum_brightwellii.AAC.1